MLISIFLNFSLAFYEHVEFIFPCNGMIREISLSDHQEILNSAKKFIEEKKLIRSYFYQKMMKNVML
ncbi:hypothetical protein EHP00_1068 [Ecytonucleospora hepatopenaei]|uniref:Uncharacterized protein n=1 Tax=Ecytonucleospora hepatopenaei TaxID=646526 RepID=A0A1W0E571_9MICR|nr:hypothetical protein EHP00_1068 [Ecytonucleospora hepatopenaei]